jgi:hypothetical protein
MKQSTSRNGCATHEVNKMILGPRQPTRTTVQNGGGYAKTGKSSPRVLARAVNGCATYELPQGYQHKHALILMKQSTSRNDLNG